SHHHISSSVNATPTTHISPLSLHDALPILQLNHTAPASASISKARCQRKLNRTAAACPCEIPQAARTGVPTVWHQSAQQSSTIRDRKSTRLNSSHRTISYAVFCLKKKKNKK